MRNTVLFLRSLTFTIVMAVATIIFSIVAVLVAPLPYRQRYYIVSRWNVFVIWAAKVICGIEYEIKGAENFPDAPAIVLSKHQSAWETIFLLANLPRPLVFVFKKEILYIPFFGWGIAMLRMIPIDRKAGKHAFKQVVEQGKRRLKEGLWIIMFPEGTRIPVGQAGEYKSGGTRLATATGAMVVPIALNSGECWPKNSFIKKPGKVTVSIGKPIASEGRHANELMEQVEQWIESEMRVISPHAYSAG